jgi:quercetin dioxygenase-like cupin family protein
MTVALSPDQPEAFAATGCAFTVLDGGAPTDGRIGVVQLDLALGWAGPPQHVHREHDETFYVVTGDVRFTSGAENMIARPGRLVTAPIGDPHAFGNADADAPAMLLCILAPERYLGYFRDLAQLAARTGGRLDPQDVLAVMARYATDPYQP